MRTSPRTLIIALAAACLVVPLVAVAQPPAGKLSRIGVLTYLYPPDADPPQAFRHQLRDLKEAIPRISRMAVLWNPTTPFHKAVLKENEAGAPSLGLQPVTIPVRSRDDFGNAFAEVTRAHADALS